MFFLEISSQIYWITLREAISLESSVSDSNLAPSTNCVTLDEFLNLSELLKDKKIASLGCEATEN